jgi:hypothetical protein
MTMNELPLALRSLLEAKNAEVKQHHLAARVGELQGSRVQEVRDVLGKWAPAEGTPAYELWLQVKRATEMYTEEIDAIRRESYRAVPGVVDPDEERFRD